MESQKEVWNKIAPEWYEFKTVPSDAATEFINESNGKILDFGGGSGRNILKIKKSKNQEIYLLDFSEKMLELAETRAKKLGIKIKTVNSTLEKTPFENNFFDAAICTAAIHCVPTKKARENTIKELFRILKPGAKAEIEVWNKNSLQFKKSPKEKYVSWRDKGKRYYYLYEEKEIYDLFIKNKFKVVKKIPHLANIIFIVEKPKI